MEKISNILLIIDGEYPADELAGEAVTIARKSGAGNAAGSSRKERRIF